MKSIKTSSLFRLAALLIIAVIVVCMVGFIAEDRAGNKDEPLPDGGGTGEIPDPTPDKDPAPQAPTPPAYTHYLTGLEITADRQKTKPLCFVTDTASPLYGISGAALTVEIPIENGKSRFLLYQDDIKSLGKIGSVSASRECILALARLFGGISVYNGRDGLFDGESGESGGFDLSAQSGYSYTESTSFVYTNGDLLLAGLQNAGLSTATATEADRFSFAPHFSDPITLDKKAETVLIPYAQSNETSLYYDAEVGAYLLGKGGVVKCDLLNGKSAAYTNAFVLFAAATTYESESVTQMTPDTLGGGKGYYFTHGTATSIEWSTDAEGKLILKKENGDTLTVNRGASYIAFYKASRASSVVFS
ncbi:MAG: DUF3048 C-terminal domain-containing protein [Clostridia bacterium]|nr:DUF3048 C-terminal domain-containing protein [Clostridia bacterium]